MVWARFSERYEHRWPSRAVSVHKPDGGADGKGLYHVRREVLDAAKAAGKATEAKKPAIQRRDGAKRKTADGLAGGDTPPHGDAAPGNGLEHDDAAGGDDGVSSASGAG